MAGHFLYKIKDVLEDLNYLNWVQRTEEKMEKEISNQGGGGLCWSLTGIWLQDFCPGGFPKEKQIPKHCASEVLRPENSS